MVHFYINMGIIKNLFHVNIQIIIYIIAIGKLICSSLNFLPMPYVVYCVNILFEAFTPNYDPGQANSVMIYCGEIM